MSGFYQLSNQPFQWTMKSGSRGNTAMDAKSNQHLSRWVNRDLQRAENTGDWSELLAKAEAQTRRFRNDFYA